MGLLVSNASNPCYCGPPPALRHWQTLYFYDPTGTSSGGLLDGQSVLYKTTLPYHAVVPDAAVLAPLVLAFYQPRLESVAQGQYDGPLSAQNPHFMAANSATLGLSIEWNGQVVYAASGGGTPESDPGYFSLDLPGLALDTAGYANVASVGPYFFGPSGYPGTPYVLVRQDLPPLAFGATAVTVTFSGSCTYPEPPADATNVIRRPLTLSNPLLAAWLVAAASG